jgi:hypothetical protein
MRIGQIGRIIGRLVRLVRIGRKGKTLGMTKFPEIDPAVCHVAFARIPPIPTQQFVALVLDYIDAAVPAILYVYQSPAPHWQKSHCGTAIRGNRTHSCYSTTPSARNGTGITPYVVHMSRSHAYSAIILVVASACDRCGHQWIHVPRYLVLRTSYPPSKRSSY